MKGFVTKVTIVFLLLLLQSCACVTRTEDLQAGKVAFEHCEYKKAFCYLLPLAAKGCPDAEYAVGYMYYYGYGTVQDPETGIFWMRLAAVKCYPQAMQALYLIQHPGDCLHTDPRCFNLGPVEESPPYIPKVEKLIQPHVVDQSPQLPPIVRHCKPVVHEFPPLMRHGIVAHAPIVGKSKVVEHPAGCEEESYPKSNKPVSMVPLLHKKLSETMSPAAEPAQSSKQFACAIQLMGNYDLEKLKQERIRLGLQDSTTIGLTQHNNKNWYILLYGKFSSASEAKLAMASLPDSVSEMKPWIKHVDEVEMLA